MAVQKLHITTYMSDVRNLLRPASFMELAQEIATLDAASLRFDDPRLIEAHNAVWVLARMKVVFNRMPVRYQQVQLDTWHKGLSSLFFLRDYRMTGSDGDVLVSSTSSWVIMDLAERRALRPSAVTDIIPPEASLSGHALETPAAKVVIPRDVAVSKVGEHVVVYSDVDSNRHTNNTRYLVWAMDCLPPEITFERPLREFEINFNREARPGETVELCHAFSDGAHYVEGRSSGAQVFICKLIF